jgi:REP element-mobilizing transposase RayT
MSVVRAFPGRTARVLHAEFRYLRRLETVVWSPPYLAASAGDVWESTVRGYVEPRWDAVS